MEEKFAKLAKKINHFHEIKQKVKKLVKKSLSSEYSEEERLAAKKKLEKLREKLPEKIQAKFDKKKAKFEEKYNGFESKVKNIFMKMFKQQTGQEPVVENSANKEEFKQGDQNVEGGNNGPKQFEKHLDRPLFGAMRGCHGGFGFRPIVLELIQNYNKLDEEKQKLVNDLLGGTPAKFVSRFETKKKAMEEKMA